MDKKIAFIGNLTNCTYWYVKYLREAGIDARLYIAFKKCDKNGKPIIPKRQDPREEDGELSEELPFWVKFFHLYPIKNFFAFRKEFDQYALNVAFESTPIFLQFSKSPLISFASGSNLREDVFGIGVKSFLLKRGFLKSRMVLFDNVDMATLTALKKLEIKKHEWIPDYIPREDQLKKAKITKIDDIFFRNFKEKFIFLSSSRLDFDQKGTDILIRGFANFIKKNKNLARLLIIDYGKDSQKTKKLTERLNIRNNITILPILSHSEIIKLTRDSTLTFGYFNTKGIHHYPFSILDALRAGNISISSIDKEAFQKIIGEAPPSLRAYSEKDVENQIKFALTNYDRIKKDFAIRGPLWIKK